ATRALSLRQADGPGADGGLALSRAGSSRSRGTTRRTLAAVVQVDDRSRKRSLRANHRQPLVASLDGSRLGASARRHADRALERRPTRLLSGPVGRERL